MCRNSRTRSFDAGEGTVQSSEEAGVDVIWPRQIRARRVTARGNRTSPAGSPQYQYIGARPAQQRPARKRLDDTSKRLGNGREGTYEGQYRPWTVAIRRAGKPDQCRWVLGSSRLMGPCLRAAEGGSRRVWLPRITNSVSCAYARRVRQTNGAAGERVKSCVQGSSAEPLVGRSCS